MYLEYCLAYFRYTEYGVDKLFQLLTYNKNFPTRLVMGIFIHQER